MASNGQTIAKLEEVRTAYITFPKDEAMFVDHAEKGRHRQGKAVEPNTVGDGPHTRNPADKYTEV